MGEIVGTSAPRETARGGALPRPVFVLALFTVLAVAMTWPLAAKAGHALIGTDTNALNDSYFGVWIFGWQAHQLLIDPLHLFSANIFYPFANSLAFSEIILPQALMYLPLALAFNNPVLAYNLVVLATFPLNGLAMYLWAFDLQRGQDDGRIRTAAAILAAIVFTFCAYKLGEIRHVQLLAAQWMPLTLLFLKRGLERPTVRNAFLTALFFALNALSSLYYAVFLAFAMVIYAAVDFAVRRYRLTRAQLAYGISAAVIAGVLIAPLLAPFLRLEAQYHFSGARDPRLFAARPVSYLASPGTNWLYGAATRPFYVAGKGQPLYPGLAAGLLALLGTVELVRRSGSSRERAAGGRLSLVIVLFLWITAAASFVLSFGPQLIAGREVTPVTLIRMPYYWLSLVITPLKGLNAPARFAVLVMLGLAALTAFGAGWLFKRAGRGWPVAAVLAGAILLLEYASFPLELNTVSAASSMSPVYAFLAIQPPGQPVVELPMGQPNFADQDRYVVYTYNSVYHWQPLVNGYSTFIPPEYYALVKDVQAFPSKASVTRLRDWGVIYLVVHSDRYKNASRLRASLDALGGIDHVQDFGSIWLYRMRE
ncbi:MAG: hypothetical protein ACM3JD_19645 [Rudaea sp.]